jgi:hypothetical protein
VELSRLELEGQSRRSYAAASMPRQFEARTEKADRNDRVEIRADRAEKK